MNEYTAITTSTTVLPVGQPIHSEMATTITVIDEAAGPFVEVSQEGGRMGKKGVLITQEEWPVIKSAIEAMLDVCRELESSEKERQS